MRLDDHPQTKRQTGKFCSGLCDPQLKLTRRPSAGHVYQGTWARTGRREFAFTFLGLQYDAADVHSGFIRVRAARTLERDGNTYNGLTDTVEILDLNLNVVAGPFVATTHGTRINAE